MLHVPITELVKDITARCQRGDVRQQDVSDLLQAVVELLAQASKLRARLEETDGRADAFEVADLQTRVGELQARAEELGAQVEAFEEDKQRGLGVVCRLVRLLAVASRGEPVPRRVVADVLADGGWKRADLARLWLAVRWQRVEDGNERKQ
jgi:hypothetical protein